jgi:hypothetical protein
MAIVKGVDDVPLLHIDDVLITLPYPEGPVQQGPVGPVTPELPVDPISPVGPDSPVTPELPVGPSPPIGPIVP